MSKYTQIGPLLILFQVDALVCAHCFQYVGSIELQIGRRLALNQPQASGKPAETPEAGTSDSEEGKESEISDDQVRKKGRGTEGVEFAEALDNPDGLGTELDEEGEHYCEEDDSVDERVPAPPETVAALLDGTLELPLSEQFPLPAVVECLGGCSDDVYCSETCASISWEAHHKLLCAGPRSEAADTEALRGFRDFADGSNNIFHVAAQVVAATVLRARKGGGATIPEHLGRGSDSAAREEGEVDVPELPKRGFVSPEASESASELRGDTSEANEVAEPVVVRKVFGLLSNESGVQNQTSIESSQQSSKPSVNSIGSDNDFTPPLLGRSASDALLKAWEPFSMGWKGVWWESVACPPEMEGRPEEEAAFRASIRELCDGSLQLLRAAFGQEAETYGPLFSLEVRDELSSRIVLDLSCCTLGLITWPTAFSSV